MRWVGFPLPGWILFACFSVLKLFSYYQIREFDSNNTMKDISNERHTENCHHLLSVLKRAFPCSQPGKLGIACRHTSASLQSRVWKC